MNGEKKKRGKFFTFEMTEDARTALHNAANVVGVRLGNPKLSAREYIMAHLQDDPVYMNEYRKVLARKKAGGQ